MNIASWRLTPGSTLLHWSQKGCSFSAPKAILCASLCPVLAPLFPDSTELIIVPDGTAVVEDDLELTASSLRRYGTRLYVLGDAVIPAESADLLAQIEFLHVTGEVESCLMLWKRPSLPSLSWNAAK